MCAHTQRIHRPCPVHTCAQVVFGKIFRDEKHSEKASHLYQSLNSHVMAHDILTAQEILPKVPQVAFNSSLTSISSKGLSQNVDRSMEEKSAENSI